MSSSLQHPVQRYMLSLSEEESAAAGCCAFADCCPSKNSPCPRWVIDSIWAYRSNRSKDHTDYIQSIHHLRSQLFLVWDASTLGTIESSVCVCILVHWILWDITLVLRALVSAGICDLPSLFRWIDSNGPGPTMSLDRAGRAHTRGPSIYDQRRVAACVQQWIWKASKSNG